LHLRRAGGQTLKLEFSFTERGPVKNINMVQAVDADGISAAQSGLGKCNLTVVEFTAKSVDVKGSCAETHAGDGRKPGRSITDIEAHVEM